MGNIRSKPASVPNDVPGAAQPKESQKLSFIPRRLRRLFQKKKTEDLSPYLVRTKPKASRTGGFSDIWEGVLTLPGKQSQRVAIKVLRAKDIPHPNDAPETIERLDKRLQREVRIWKPLRSPFIVPFLGYAVVDGQPALVSPWYDNGDARHYIWRHQHCNRRAIVMQVAQGLAYLHGLPRPIVHFDVKTLNVLIDDSGVARLTDFGISKIIDDVKTGFTTTNSNIGAIQYSAPEANEGKERTVKSDVYSFACFVLEVMTGKVPFYDEKNTARVMMKKSKNPVPAHNLFPEIPANDPLWMLLDRCWSPEPEARPTMAAVVQELHRLGFKSDG